MSRVSLLLALVLFCGTFAGVFGAGTDCSFNELDSGRSAFLHQDTNMEHDVLTLFVAIPDNYLNTNISFVGGNGVCPGNQPWVKVSTLPANCSTLYKTTMTWKVMHDNCGGLRTQFEKNVVFKYSILINSVEVINLPVDEYIESAMTFNRPLSNTLDFRISFPRFITVYANETIVTNPPEGAAKTVLTESIASYDSDASQASLNMQLVTVNTFPQHVIYGVYTNLPEGVNATLVADTRADECKQEPGAKCIQYWRSIATVKDSVRCNFTGEYKIMFFINCLGTWANDCPATNFTSTVTLRTANHCPTLSTSKVITATLSAELNTYSDSAYTTAATNYRLRDWVYGEMTTSSPEASIQSTTLTELYLEQPGYDPVPMLATSVRTDQGAHSECVFVTSAQVGVNEKVRFACRLKPKYVILPAAASRVVTWRAVTEVVFLHTESMPNQVQKKLVTTTLKQKNTRTMADSSLGSAEAEAAVMVTAPAHQASAHSSTSAASTNVATSMSLIISALLALALTVFNN